MRHAVPTTLGHTPERSRPWASRLVDVIRRWAAGIDASFSRAALNRRVLHQLSVLSSRELADIGLTGADLIEATLSENGDATHFLVRRRDERWSARRARRTA